MAAPRNKALPDRSSADKKTDDGPAAARVILKNLVYVIGLPEAIASEQVARDNLDTLARPLFRPVRNHTENRRQQRQAIQ
jgi:hypothetical protein